MQLALNTCDEVVTLASESRLDRTSRKGWSRQTRRSQGQSTLGSWTPGPINSTSALKKGHLLAKVLPR